MPAVVLFTTLIHCFRSGLHNTRMSWDIFVQHFPANAKTVADIPSDFKPAPIGDRTTIIEKIKDIVPSADFSDPTWGLSTE